MNLKAFFFLCLTIMYNSATRAQHFETIDLYEKVPGEITVDGYTEKEAKQRIYQVTKPQLYAYRPLVANGTAVVICPGGGYGGLAIMHEGHQVAQKFAENGITAFVLKYRLPSDLIMKDKKIGPLQDAQQAIRYIREHAGEYHINPGRIGIIGFSAGGHLAATASTHFNHQVIPNEKGTSVRPDFSVLIYAVITLGEFTDQGTRNRLLGEHPSKDLVDFYSNELQVSAATPIAFLVHANDDSVVPVQNSLNYLLALNKYKIRNEIHVYPSGGHGFGLDNKTSKDYWFDRLLNWLHSENMVD